MQVRYHLEIDGILQAENGADAVERIKSELSLSLRLRDSIETMTFTTRSEADDLEAMRRMFPS
jgi:hypothetical protein